MQSIRDITAKQTDPLSNVMIKTKRTQDAFIRPHQKDIGLNYGGQPTVSQNIQVQLLTCISMLQQCHSLYQKKLQRKHNLYNFFLDDTQGQDDPIKNKFVKQKLQLGQKVRGYCLKATWTKGGRKNFFAFVKQGQIVSIIRYENGWVQVQFQDGIGLMRLVQIRIIRDYQ